MEIQEPTCIADAAVLMILNSALEKDGLINLPDRVVKRHPDFICMMTTNRNYEGCRPLNQALRNRFDMTRKVELPESEELVGRLLKSTNCTDSDFLTKVVESVLALNDNLEGFGVQSVLSERNINAFISDIMDGFDYIESINEDFIWNLTTDKDEINDIETFLRDDTRLYSARCRCTSNW